MSDEEKKTIDLAYALPSSRLCIDSQVSTTVDGVLNKTLPPAPKSTVSLEVGGGPRNQVLEISAGPFVNTNVSLETTDDGRLKSTNVELDGQAGKVVVGVVGGAVALASAFLALPVTAGRRPATLAVAGARRGLTEAAPGEPDLLKLEERAFEKERPEVDAMRKRYVALVKGITEEIASTSEQLLADPASIDKEAVKRLGRVEDLRERYATELDRLNELFKAWRASTQQTLTESHRHYIELDETVSLTVEDGKKPDLSGATEAVRFAWEKLGVVVTVEPGQQQPEVEAGSRKNKVLVRVPRLAMVSLFGRDPADPDEKAVLRERTPQLVMDAACETRIVKLRKSIWSKRGVTLGFSDLGGLTSFSHNSSSAAAAAAGAAGELPAKVAESLESTLKARKALGSLGSIGLEEELNRVKHQVETKEKEISLAGLTTSRQAHERLARLKLRAEIKEQREKGIETKAEKDPDAEAIKELKQQVEQLWLEAMAKKLGGGQS